MKPPSGPPNGMLPPFHVLAETLRILRRVNRKSKSPPPFCPTQVVHASKNYRDKLSLLRFQSERLMLSYKALQNAWRTFRTTEGSPGFAAAYQRLSYDLCFEFVALRICYDALAWILRPLLPKKLRGKVPNHSFHDLACWMQKNGTSQGAPDEVVQILTSAWPAFRELRALRDGFVHQTSNTWITRRRNSQFAFALPGTQPEVCRAGLFAVMRVPKESQIPVKAGVRKYIKSHFETAFRMEAWALKHQQASVKVPPCWSELPPCVADLYRYNRIRTFGVEARIQPWPGIPQGP